MNSHEIAPEHSTEIRSWWEVLAIVVIGFVVNLLLAANVAYWLEVLFGE